MHMNMSLPLNVSFSTREEIAQRNQIIAWWDKAIVAEEAAIADRDVAIVVRDVAIAERDAAIAERDGRICKFEDQVCALQKQVATLDIQQGQVPLEEGAEVVGDRDFGGGTEVLACNADMEADVVDSAGIDVDMDAAGPSRGDDGQDS